MNPFKTKDATTADPAPAITSEGQWTPQKIRAREIRQLATMYAIASGMFINKRPHAIPKKNDAWPEGKDGCLGFLTKALMGNTSEGRRRW